MVSTYPSTTDNDMARYADPNGGIHEPISMSDVNPPQNEIGDASSWWLRRVQQDAELLATFLFELAKANRGPMALGGISREFRRFADRHKGTERMSRDRLYGALVLLALRGRVHIYGDGTTFTRNPTFQAESIMVGSRHPD
jgi:hypothetical protein